MSKFDQTLKVLKDQNQPLESIEENNDISQEKLDRQNELLEKLHIKTDRLRPTQVKSIVTQQSDQQDKIVDAINEGFKSNVKEIVVKENKKLSSVVTTQQHPDGGPTWKQIDDKLREDIKLIKNQVLEIDRKRGNGTGKQIDDKLREDIKLLKNQAEIDRRRGKSTALNAVELTAPALAWVYKKLKDVDENEYVKNTSWGKEQEKANKDLIKAVEKSNPEIHITPEKLKLDKRKETENSEKSVDAI